MLRGSESLESFEESANEAPDIVSNAAWKEICALQEINGSFRGLKKSFVNDSKIWQDFMNAPEIESAKLPTSFEAGLTQFQKNLIFRALRMDKVI